MTQDIWQAYQWLEEELSSLIGPVKFSAEINLRLERITHLMELLGNPHRAYRSVHIGGTSGKGSTSTMVADVLAAAGYKVGLHTSPHLQILNERHRVNGRFASTSKLIECWKVVKPAIEAVRDNNPWGAPSYFEAQVALSFYLFALEKVDFAVIEVGLGGRLDSTNVIPADVAVLTSVGLDHTAILGDTVIEIATDKSGIIKPGQSVISGVSQPEVQALITDVCADQGATMQQFGRDFNVAMRPNGHCDIQLKDHQYDDVELGLQGEFQAQNAAVALAAVHSLTDIVVTEEAVRSGLAHSRLAGRVEFVQERPLVLLDGAHNPDKMRAAASVIELQHADRRIITVLGIKAGKKAADIVPTAAELSDEMILTSFVAKGLWTSVDPQKLAEIVAEAMPELPLHVLPHPEDAIRTALEIASPEDLIWVTGSLYLVGDIRSHWQPIPEMVRQLEDVTKISDSSEQDSLEKAS